MSSLTFETDAEPWTTYVLSYGTQVRVKVILISAKRVEGQFADDGTPGYNLQCQQIMHVDAPDHLKQLPTVRGHGTA